jgi:apolipoprotein N-acyltransferase
LSAVGGVSFGEPSRLLVRPAGAVGVAICYEIADGSALAAAARDGAGWLLASANLDPYPAQLQGQFAALAQLRAIETGRWLVSAANTGPSLLVDSTGAVRQRLSTGRAGTLSVQLQVRAGLTGYSRTGELPLLLLAAAAGTARQRSRVRQS